MAKTEERRRRREFAADQWILGKTQSEIVLLLEEELGISVTCSTISKDLKWWRENSEIPERRGVIVEHIALLHKLRKPYAQAATEGDQQALWAVLKIMEREAKLLGLDAPAYRAIESEADGVDPINVNEDLVRENQKRHGAIDPKEFGDYGDTERTVGSADDTAE